MLATGCVPAQEDMQEGSRFKIVREGNKLSNLTAKVLLQQNDVVFTATEDVDAIYDAYERDIAVVSFHFERPTIFAYVRLVMISELF